MISVIITQLCGQSMKTTTDNRETNGCGCIPVKVYLQDQATGHIWLEAVKD